MRNLSERLARALQAAGVPIISVSIGSNDDRATWTIDFAKEATDEQRATAAALMARLDTSEPTPVVAPRPLTPVRKIDFLRLLQADEYAAFETLAESGDPTMRYARALFDTAPELHLDDPIFTGLLQAVVEKGVLTPERAQAVVAVLTKAL